jgi:hypothetical protein
LYRETRIENDDKSIETFNGIETFGCDNFQRRRIFNVVIPAKAGIAS